ncbi:hypothetical protein [Hahella sp. HN01]|uniref:hypothetical protein n=1 Tax=Hahella sp. HN01 TaxID=2847262 RepID=UPI001C1EBF3A|nr:hypothetical protein [Hahella sp. HN01]MBU6951321.1 hypothetical protein [Hahella sp. HN01]
MTQDKITSILTQGLNFLEDEGFKLARADITESKASGILYTVTYHFENARRGIIVSYFTKPDIAITSIENLDNEFNFSDSGAMRVPFPKYEIMEGEVEEKLTKYLDTLKIELLDKYLDILRGGSFENDAFDWSRYK